MKHCAVLLAISMLFACSTHQSEPEQERQQTQCPEQRPQICTMDYQPVCATRDTGVRCITTPCPSSEQKTYSNGCSACTDPAVVSYITGECPVTTIR